jgi:hypothetical protein
MPRPGKGSARAVALLRLWKRVRLPGSWIRSIRSTFRVPTIYKWIACWKYTKTRRRGRYGAQGAISIVVERGNGDPSRLAVVRDIGNTARIAVVNSNGERRRLAFVRTMVVLGGSSSTVAALIL